MITLTRGVTGGILAPPLHPRRTGTRATGPSAGAPVPRLHDFVGSTNKIAKWRDRPPRLRDCVGSTDKIAKSRGGTWRLGGGRDLGFARDVEGVHAGVLGRASSGGRVVLRRQPHP